MKECVESALGPDMSGALIGSLKHYCGKPEEFCPIICLSMLLSARLERNLELR